MVLSLLSLLSLFIIVCWCFCLFISASAAASFMRLPCLALLAVLARAWAVVAAAAVEVVVWLFNNHIIIIIIRLTYCSMTISALVVVVKERGYKKRMTAAAAVVSALDASVASPVAAAYIFFVLQPSRALFSLYNVFSPMYIQYLFRPSLTLSSLLSCGLTASLAWLWLPIYWQRRIAAVQLTTALVVVVIVCVAVMARKMQIGRRCCCSHLKHQQFSGIWGSGDGVGGCRWWSIWSDLSRKGEKEVNEAISENEGIHTPQSL